MLHIGWGFGVCSNKVVWQTHKMAGVDISDDKKVLPKAAIPSSKPESSDTDESDEHTVQKRLRPLACLQPGVKVCVALIVLNQPMLHQYPHLIQLWNRGVIRAATDGAINYLCDIMNLKKDTDFVPDLVTGDFDSSQPDALQFMKDKGAKLVETQDENYTDFTKCLKIVDRTLEHNKLYVDCLVALGAFGGRFDHTISIINTLFDVTKRLRYPVYLIGDDNLACLLMPGSYILEVDTGLEEGCCSLIPIGGRCNSITTTGLKYNLENQEMQFGALVSTSNKLEKGAKEVTVTTDSPVLWTMGIKKLKLKET
ncbi:thiamine pyrophosphokinase 1 [Holothuria leucospilota]|uniref:Thiamine pyrophosphokinase n=1 Tax=Holothuria leucospilota TaxID=206669 RepID=A0A9Q1H7H3_HOLLE|nr:thiamine pyrophosphokinase 1 [Holothuria leucospilota]